MIMSGTATVLQQFVSGLKSRNEDTRAKSAKDLQHYVTTELREVRENKNTSCEPITGYSTFNVGCCLQEWDQILILRSINTTLFLFQLSQDEATTFYDELNHHIFELVSSSDVNEKKGGILAIGERRPRAVCVLHLFQDM